MCEFDGTAESHMKTHCFHHFHVACLAEWYIKRLHEIREKQQQEEADLRKLGHLDRAPKKRFVACPVCREPLSEADIKLIIPHVEALNNGPNHKT